MTQSSRGRARIGVFVPYTNVNLEADMAMMCPAGVTMHYTRLGGYDIDEVPDASQMAGLAKADMDDAIQLLAGAKPDVVLYGCTSATLALGPAFDTSLSEQIKNKSGAICITAAGALVNALSTLGVRNIAFASPYVAALNNDAIDFLSTQGFNTVSRYDHPVDLGNYGQGELQPEEILQFALTANHTDAEAIVLSCTDLRAAETIQQLEKETGKPVISSNQAMLFGALQALQFNLKVPGYGTLFNQLHAYTEGP